MLVGILKSQSGGLINRRATSTLHILPSLLFLGIFEILKRCFAKKALCQQFCHSSGRLVSFGRLRRPVIRQTGWIGSCV